MKFTVECEMEERWIPHFLGALKQMQHLGAIGSSRKVSLFSDGDGDFRPVFVWPDTLPIPAKPLEIKCNGDMLFDAK